MSGLEKEDGRGQRWDLELMLTLGPYERYDPQKVHNSLTAGSLRGPGKLAVPPVAFSKHDESEAIS